MKKIISFLGILIFIGISVMAQSKFEIELWGYELNEKWEERSGHDCQISLEAGMEYHKAYVIVRSFDDWRGAVPMQGYNAFLFIKKIIIPKWKKGNVWDGRTHFKENYDKHVTTITVAELVEAQKLFNQGNKEKWKALCYRIIPALK